MLFLRIFEVLNDDEVVDVIYLCVSIHCDKGKALCDDWSIYVNFL